MIIKLTTPYLDEWYNQTANRFVLIEEESADQLKFTFKANATEPEIVDIIRILPGTIRDNMVSIFDSKLYHDNTKMTKIDVTEKHFHLGGELYLRHNPDLVIK